MSQIGSRHIDRSEAVGARAAERLEIDRVAWMTTVAADGTPQTSPIWFLWDGNEFLLYSLDSPRVANIERAPRVSLHLDGNGLGGDVVVVEGTARIDSQAPAADHNADYLEKYGAVMEEYGWTPAWFTSRYRVPVRIAPTKYRYW